MKRILLIGALICASFSAHAQTPVVVNPNNATASISSDVLAVTNAFQSLWALNTNRHDFLIQNNGSSTMFVFFGPIANAITSNSLQLSAGTIFRGGNNDTILSNQISIAGTAGQRFFTIQE